MQATQILMNEHRTIEQVLGALEGMAELVSSEQRMYPEHARQAITFIRQFADKFHHAKEEDLLFVALEAVGFSRQGGPVAVMLHEHDVGRALVRRMADAVEQAAAGDTVALGSFADGARQFAALLRGHIQKEDQILYPMTDDALSPESQAALLVDFARAEQAHGGQAAREEFEKTAARLAGLYAAQAPRQESQASDFGCGSMC